MRIRDLGLKIEGSPLEPLITRLYEELDARGIDFHPPCYLADEWLCPDKIPIIGIPFYLADLRLKQIEQKIMFEAEGGADASCMELLRHECGHALNYAYELYKRTRWRELFGSFSTKYSGSYNYRPYSKRFVVHLRDHYAQAHPDEDFAETFAVWFTPASTWREKYKNWPVIKKLQYIDGVMAKIQSQPPSVAAQGNPPWSASRMTSTLAAYYDRKRRFLGSEFQGYYDDSLKELFTLKPHSDAAIKASALLRTHRRQIVSNVARWTGHRKYDIHELVNKLMIRCDRLGLYAVDKQTDSILALTSLLTAIASNTYPAKRKL